LLSGLSRKSDGRVHRGGEVDRTRAGIVRVRGLVDRAIGEGDRTREDSESRASSSLTRTGSSFDRIWRSFEFSPWSFDRHREVVLRAGTSIEGAGSTIT
jgi:hypothetical protein